MSEDRSPSAHPPDAGKLTDSGKMTLDELDDEKMSEKSGDWTMVSNHRKANSTKFHSVPFKDIVNSQSYRLNSFLKNDKDGDDDSNGDDDGDDSSDDDDSDNGDSSQQTNSDDSSDDLSEQSDNDSNQSSSEDASSDSDSRRRYKLK